MKGWDTAEKDLEANLNRILEILKKDEYITDRDKKIQKLTKNISELDTSLGFYSPAFYLAHKLKYLSTVKALARTARPKSYSQFRFDEVVLSHLSIFLLFFKKNGIRLKTKVLIFN
ncbi:hypothetical protein OAV92_04355 [Crocinitomicaceae bacterium]|nr:hypothetical protein [Crocinitomicaceae bacterium]